jgi:hypothetical protein
MEDLGASKTARRIQILLALFVAILCFVTGGGIEYSAQRSVLIGLRYVSGIVFGVIGAWVAIVNPRELRATIRRLPDDLSNAEENVRLFQRLLRAMRYSTCILAIVLLMTIAEPIAKESSFLIDHRFTVRRFTFAVLGVATIAQLWSILLAIAPSEDYDYLLRRDSKRSERLSATLPSRESD